MKRLAMLVVIGMLMVSCATIMNGPNQTVPVRSSPSDAEVYQDGQHVATTPGYVEVKRKCKKVYLDFEKEGYEDEQVILNPTISNWTIGNAIWGIYGVIPGWVIDLLTGSAWRYVPKEASVTLHGGGSVSDGDFGTEEDLVDFW